MLFLIACVAGMFCGLICSLIPGLHIYNVIAITMALMFGAFKLFSGVDPIVIVTFLIAMTVTFSILFTISTQYFQPCDDSYRFIMLPHEKFFFEGRAHEAVLLGGLGSLIGIFIIALIYPFVGPLVSFILAIIRPHTYWLVGLMIVFILMSEWPKDHGSGKTVAQRFFDGWGALLMGYLTFALAGMLGMFVFYKTIVPIDMSFQNLMPVFVGLFAVPSFILNFITKVRIPKQHFAESIDVSKEDIVRGGFAGMFAGSFASLLPGFTPGPALLVAGHTTVTGGDKQFIIAGGVCRVIYYIGALMLLFIPDLYHRRGGLAINVSIFYASETWKDYLFILGIVVIVGLASFLLMTPFSKFCYQISTKIHFKLISAIGFALIVALVYIVTGPNGLLVMAVSTVIGLVPNVWHTRRINLISVLLVPMFLNLAGVGPQVAQFLGLIK